jgi:predicted nucleic acid-binding protein
MNGTINECFLDSSILIEYIKGTQTELLEHLIASKAENYINHIVYSEFVYHFLSIMSGKSPLRLKKSSRINEILKEHEPIEFIHNFKILDMDEEIIDKSDYFMSRYNLLPNDALIFATCHIHEVKYLASFDGDFQEICDKEDISLINSPEKFEEIERLNAQGEKDVVLDESEEEPNREE